MSKLEKSIEKLLRIGSVITFKELEYILKKLGYIEKKTGKTSGSRRAYINREINHIIRLHKPHPDNELKDYVKKAVISELQRIGKL